MSPEVAFCLADMQVDSVCRDMGVDSEKFTSYVPAVAAFSLKGSNAFDIARVMIAPIAVSVRGGLGTPPPMSMEDTVVTRIDALLS